MEIGTLESTITGAQGCKLIDSASGAVTATFKYFVVNEDAVLTTLTGAESSNQLTAQGLSAKTISKGIMVTPIAKYYTNVTVSSGSIFIYY